MPKENKKTDVWDDIERDVLGEIKAARDFVKQNIAADRTERWDRYYGRGLGNEQEGRSQYMSRDVMEAVEQVMPTLIRTFASGDSKIELDVEGQPPVVGKALVRKINDDLSDDDDNSIFLCFYQWIKDALVSESAYISPRWGVDYEKKKVTFPRLTTKEMMQLDQDPDVRIIDGETDGFGNYFNIKMEVKSLSKDRLEVDNVPHWEFLFSPEARHMNDEHGKGVWTRVSLDYLKRVNRSMKREGDDDFFKNLDQFETDAPYTGIDMSISDDIEGGEQAYRDNVFAELQSSRGYKAPKNRLTIVEWATRLDVDGDGFLEDILCWVVNGKMIRWEINKDGCVPWCGLSPIIDCYKFSGIAWSELVIEIQNLKTMMLRRIMDNFDFASLGRHFVHPSAWGSADIAGLVAGIPGDVIMADPDKIRTDLPKPFGMEALNLVEFIEKTKEQRVGITRYSQGTDADSLNKTASGIAMIQSAAQQRIDLIARIFAETGIRDFYRKCAILYQKNLRKPFTVKVQGQDVTVQPQQLKGKIKARVNMGIEAQMGLVEAQKIERMFKFLATVNQMYPGIIGPQEVHNLAVKYIASLGFRQTEDFISEMRTFIQNLKAKMQQANEERQAQSKQIQDFQNAQIQLAAGDQKIRAADSATKRQKVSADFDIDRAKLAADAKAKADATAQRERDSQRDYRVDLLQVAKNQTAVHQGAA